MKHDQSGFSAIELLIFIVVVLVISGVGFYIAGQKLSHNNASSESKKSYTPSVSSAGNNAITVKSGSSVTADAYNIKYLGSTHNPSVSGDTADRGTEYLEADFSITTIANKDNYALNIIYYPSILPAGYSQHSGVSLGTVDSPHGDVVNPLTAKSIPAKRIQIIGKQSVAANPPPSDGSAATVNVYYLYEVPKGDNGRLEWSTLDGNTTYDFAL